MIVNKELVISQAEKREDMARIDMGIVLSILSGVILLLS
jgi:hypothetical protein